MLFVAVILLFPVLFLKNSKTPRKHLFQNGKASENWRFSGAELFSVLFSGEEQQDLLEVLRRFSRCRFKGNRALMRLGPNGDEFDRRDVWDEMPVVERRIYRARKKCLRQPPETQLEFSRKTTVPVQIYIFRDQVEEKGRKSVIFLHHRRSPAPRFNAASRRLG